MAAVGVLAMLIVKGRFEKSEWYVMACGMLFYSAVSPMTGALWTGNFRTYALRSILTFLLLSGLLWFAADRLSEDAFSEAREIRMLLVAIGIFFFVMIGLSVVYRAVVGYVKKM